MSDQTDYLSENGECRRRGQCRRVNSDRRVNGERRRDPRGGSTGRKRTVKAWVRTLTNPRIGVDRRKGTERRQVQSERPINVKSLLTQEELAELLK